MDRIRVIQTLKDYIDINQDCIIVASEDIVKIKARSRIQAFETAISVINKRG